MTVLLRGCYTSMAAVYAAIPRWVERYLGVMQEIARLHAQYVEPDTKGPKK